MKRNRFHNRGRRPLESRALAFLCATGMIASAGSHCFADTVEWAVGGDGDGAFHDDSNWSPAIVPGASDEADFSRDGTFTVTYTTNATTDILRIGAGEVTFDLGGNVYSALRNTVTASSPPGFRLSGGGTVTPSLLLTNGELRIFSGILGEEDGDEGSLVLSGADAFFNVQESLFLGIGGIGEMLVNSGAKASAKNAFVGVTPSDGPDLARSIVRVASSGSEWNIAADLRVSNLGGPGRVEAVQGGVITAQRLFITPPSSFNAAVYAANFDSLIHIQGDAKLGGGTSPDGAAVLAATEGGKVLIDGNLSYDHNSNIQISDHALVEVGSITRTSDEAGGGFYIDGATLHVRGDASTFDLGFSTLFFSNLQVDGALQLDPRRPFTLTDSDLTVGSIAGDGEFNFSIGRLEVGSLTLGAGSELRSSLAIGDTQPFPTSIVSRQFHVDGATDIQDGGALQLTRTLATFSTVANQGSLTIDQSDASFLGKGPFGLNGLVSTGELRITDSKISGVVLVVQGSNLEVAGEVVFDAEVGAAENITRIPGDPGETPAITFNGGFAPGALGAPISQVSIDADVTFGAENKLAIELGGASPETADSVAVTGALLIDGTLEVTFGSGYTPEMGHEFEFLTASSLSGNFSSVSLPPLPEGLVYDTVAIRSGLLRIAAVLEPGTGSGIPHLMNYQGRLAVDGVNFDGPGQFKFALVQGEHAGAAEPAWTNDGTADEEGMPAAAVSIEVSQGLYSVLLGDPTLANMTSIPAAVFSNADLRLRVWFDDGVHGWQRLAPDKRLASVGRAVIAGSVPDGSIGPTQLAPGAAAAALAATGWTAPPAQALVLSLNDNDSQLADAGYAKIGHINQTWQRHSPADAPTGRIGHSAVWTGSEMIVWGGEDASGLANTGARFDPASKTWIPMSLTNAPSARHGHTAVWTGSEMIIWGGWAGLSPLGSGAKYDPATDTWTSVATTGAPSARGGHSAVWGGDAMTVFGGYTAGAPTATGAIYHPTTNEWSPMAPATEGRYAHTAVWTGDEMIVWGGLDENGTLGTGSRYSVLSDTWSALSQANAPSARDGHTAIWTGSKMIVWGGSAYLGTGGVYDPGADTWTATSESHAPAGRTAHTATWTGSELVIWGGATAFQVVAGDGGRYDPATDVWTALSSAGAPAPRERHTAVWTDEEILVWGGRAISQFLPPNAFAFDPDPELQTLFLYQKP